MKNNSMELQIKEKNNWIQLENKKNLLKVTKKDDQTKDTVYL